MSNNNSNSGFPFIIMFWLFWWLWMILFVFDDDKRPANKENAIEFKADTNCITAQELIDQGKVNRVTTFTADTEKTDTLSGKYYVIDCKIHNNRGCVNAGGLYVDDPMTRVFVNYWSNNYNPASVFMPRHLENKDVFVSSLVSAWGNGWPYNSMCPVDCSGPGSHALVGCMPCYYYMGEYHYDISDYHIDNQIPSVIYKAAVSTKSLWGESASGFTYSSPAVDPLYKNSFKGVLSGTEISRLSNAVLSANSPGSKLMAYFTEMEKINQEQEELSEDMDNAPLAIYEQANVACYIQKNYCPISSVILDIYKDRLSRN